MFREIIKREIKEQKIKQIEIAKAVGIYPASLSDYLNGNKNISSDTVEKILIKLSLYITKPVANIYEDNRDKALTNNFEWTKT